MKKILNWESPEVVNIFDEVTLWSAPFGRLLLENMPMFSGAKIADIGFGTGFPLIELSQRFGGKSKIYGIDIWQEGIERAKEKVRTLELENVEILQESATQISIESGEIDLVISNLGINNFDQKEQVYSEVHRILKKSGKLCLTTNPIGTFEELFKIFFSIFEEMKWKEVYSKLDKSIRARNTKMVIVEELKQHRFKLLKSESDSTNIRFVDAKSILNHSLMRIGFRASWEEIIGEENKEGFFERLISKVNNIIESEGEFKMTIPMLYLEFAKD